MAENAEQQQESLFRPNKRRKVFRKRTVENDQHAAERQDGSEELDGSKGGVNATQDGSSEKLSVVRRPVAKKHGIGFSSSAGANPSAARQDASIESALVPFEKDAETALQGDRFTKPTGKVVVEDKHLTAYVDSKLAELRSSSATPLTTSRNSPVPPTATLDDNSSSQAATAVGLRATTSAEPAAAEDATEARRTGYPYGSRGRPRKPRRQPHARDANDIARDAMVDAIMSESQVPLYDQSSAAAASNAEPSGIDMDEAAAEAFKAEFLADLEQRKRRKPPTAPTAGQVSSGPKLGGSRSQREKMKALEEAKNATAKK